MSLVYLKFERIILKIKGQVRTILSILDRDERKECCLDPTDRKEERRHTHFPLSLILEIFVQSIKTARMHSNAKGPKKRSGWSVARNRPTPPPEPSPRQRPRSTRRSPRRRRRRKTRKSNRGEVRRINRELLLRSISLSGSFTENDVDDDFTEVKAVTVVEPTLADATTQDPKDASDDEAVLLSRLLSVTKAARNKLARSKSFSSSTALRLGFPKATFRYRPPKVVRLDGHFSEDEFMETIDQF